MKLIKELNEHLPFTAFAAGFGMLLLLVWSFLNVSWLLASAEHLFHIFHPAHILFSAIATTAMFLKYEKKSY